MFEFHPSEIVQLACICIRLNIKVRARPGSVPIIINRLREHKVSSSYAAAGMTVPILVHVVDIARNFGGLGGSVVAVLLKHSVAAVLTARREHDCVNGCAW